MSSAPTMTGGLKVNAKRTAFADLSNTVAAQLLVNQKGPKNTVKMEGLLAEASIASGTDAFRQPAQRPSRPPVGASIQPKVVNPVPPLARSELVLSSAHGATTRKSAVPIYSDSQNIGREQVTTHLNPPTRREPSLRQYKSQPQLKPEAPVLRRTQSRLLGNSYSQAEALPVLADLTEALYEDAVEHVAEIAPIASHAAEMADGVLLSLSAGIEVVTAPADDMQTELVDDKIASTTSLSEPEEYWDEEEEDEAYDDQGYTTAHSFRSRGDLTTGGVTTLPQPKMTNKVLRELEAAKAYVESTRPQYDIEEDMWDISMVAEYSEEIFEYMRELEVSLPFPCLSTSLPGIWQCMNRY